MPRKLQVAKLQEALGYNFNDISLLACALTHRSARPGKDLAHGINNERLEFLGDAVLSLVTADFLYAQRQHFTEGNLSRLRAQYVCHDNLSKAAEALNLADYMKSDRTLRSAAALADAIEAIFGAVFVDSNLETARKVIFHVLREPSVKIKIIDKDAKTKLQEFIQASIHQTPKYIVLEKTGPAHAPIYLIGVKINDQLISSASGDNIKTAAQSAAEKALEIIKNERNPEGSRS